MRITKLHILIFLLACGLGYSAYYYRNEKQRQDQEMEARLLAERIERQNQMTARETAERKEAEAQDAPSANAAEAASSTGPAKNAPIDYTVRPGDTLWTIAKDKNHFGEGHRWYDIWKANEEKIRDFDHLRAGQTLTIPLDKPDGYEWPLTPENRKRKILAAAPRAARRARRPAPTN